MTEEQWEEWKKEVDTILDSKVEEWKLLGYEKVKKEEIWDCFMKKLPRLDAPEPMRLYWVVSELFHLKVNDYMNWLTLEAYQGPSWFDNEDAVSFRLDSFKKEQSHR
ncbi:post-transcriptional regulator [Evansella sp. AB-P1]|uniref:post-transcriptional regulator n=1 Tax=Evansella sp. AB-P1 TaxID=3037653 RepID=UPI00241E653F|nr:post-transcriptional regulator [Evansella sp. AB-P1]MDG5786443.1 post-transcriptional regulator [Evansella sp. AB-P1]